MESYAANPLDSLTDIEFLELIIRQFASRPSLQLVLGIVRDHAGNDALLSTVTDRFDSKELRAIADRLDADGTSWKRLVKKPD